MLVSKPIALNTQFGWREKVATFPRIILAEAVTFSGASIKANPVSQMTARELEILRLLGRGDKIVEVANALELSYSSGVGRLVELQVSGEDLALRLA